MQCLRCRLHGDQPALATGDPANRWTNSIRLPSSTIETIEIIEIIRLPADCYWQEQMDMMCGQQYSMNNIHMFFFKFAVF